MRKPEIALRMIKKGMAVTEIAELTGLSQKEVNDLIKSTTKN